MQEKVSIMCFWCGWVNPSLGLRAGYAALRLRDGFPQSEHIGQWATPHHLCDVRKSAPSWIWGYSAYSDITIYV